MKDPKDMTTDELFNEEAGLAEKQDEDSKRREKAVVAELKRRGAIKDRCNEEAKRRPTE